MSDLRLSVFIHLISPSFYSFSANYSFFFLFYTCSSSFPPPVLLVLNLRLPTPPPPQFLLPSSPFDSSCLSTSSPSHPCFLLTKPCKRISLFLKLLKSLFSID